jgi:hypothetical protein
VSGSAVLDGNVLVDSLVTDVIDGLRAELAPQFGVRPFRVFTVRRVWSGSIVGEGTATDHETELLPQPVVSYRTRHEMTPGGIIEVGETVLTEISLSYTFAELTGGALAVYEQWLICTREAYGQGNPAQYYTVAAPPVPDREKDMGWRLALRHAAVAGCPP